MANVEVPLIDPGSDKLHVKLRSDWDNVARPDDRELLAAVEDDLRAKADQIGASALMASLQDRRSNSLRVTNRQSVEVSDFDPAFAGLAPRPGPVVQAE